MDDNKGVLLTSFEHIPISGIVNDSFTSPDQSGISSSDSSPVKSSPLKKHIMEEHQTKNEDSVQYQNTKNREGEKYKRISELANSVFGDTIIQNANQPKKERKISVESLTESEKCYFCNRKVYVMERQSAEGLFFHRKCFRCCVCKCQLLLGNYAFNGDEEDENGGGNFYCKMHFNRLIYQTPEPTKQTPVNQTSDKRRRPLTQVIEQKDVHQAFISKSTDIVQLSPKFSHQIRDIQSKLKDHLPELVVPPKKKTSLINEVENKSDKKYLTVRDDIDSVPTDDVKNPYDKFAAKSLLDSHPSLMHPSLVVSSSFFTAAKHSISTPNLTKLIQEDSMFEEERKIHVQKMNKPVKTNVLQTDTPPQRLSIRKKLSVPDNLIKVVYDDKDSAFSENSVDSLRDAYGSECYRNRYESFNFSREDSIGAAHRRPLPERRAQYPISMAFSDGIMASGLTPVSVEIDLDEKVIEETPRKKKKLVLKKKKAKKVTKHDTIEEANEEAAQISPKKLKGRTKSLEKSIEIIKPNEKEARGREKKIPDEDDWVMVKSNDKKSEELLSDSTSSSEEEQPSTKEYRGLFKRALHKKPKKKALTEKEQELFEQKQKRKQQRKIRKEMKEREMKRLWEAQSIQRKLNEVDVKQFELEERAREVEKDLRNTTLPQSEINSLTFDWLTLVNEKNTLLRFESELVIQSNSIQLEDRQARLEQQIRDLLTAEKPHPDSHKEVDHLTKELVDTVEQRNALVEMLEEDRIREMEEDKTLRDAFAKKSHDLGMDRLI